MTWVLFGYFLKELSGLSGNVYAAGENGKYYIVAQDAGTVKLVKLDANANVLESVEFSLSDPIKFIKVINDTVFMVYDSGVVVYKSAVRKYDVSANLFITDFEIFHDTLYRFWGYDTSTLAPVLTYSSSKYLRFDSVKAGIIKGITLGDTGYAFSIYDTTLYISKEISSAFIWFAAQLTPAVYLTSLWVDTLIDTLGTRYIFLLSTVSDSGGYRLNIFASDYYSNTYRFYITGSGTKFFPFGISAKSFDTVAVWGLLDENGNTFGFIFLLKIGPNSSSITILNQVKFTIEGTITLYFDLDNLIALFHDLDNGKVYFMKMDGDLTACNISPLSFSISGGRIPAPGVITYIDTSSSYSITSTAPALPSPISLTPNTVCPTYTTRPRVVFTQPDSGEVDVPLSANIGVWFSEPMDTTSVNNSTVRIRG